MSVFIKVSRFGSEDRLFYFRDLMVTIGETAHGFLASSGLIASFFTLGVIENRAIVHIDSEHFSIDGKPLERGAQCFVQSGSVMRGRDYEFTIALTHSASELAARLSAEYTEELQSNFKNKQFPQLRFQLAQWSKSYPLLEGFDLTVGSALDDAIFLDCPGVHGHHLSIRNNSSNVEVLTRMGHLRIANGESTQSVTVSSSQDLVIEPLGLILEIQFPRIA